MPRKNVAEAKAYNRAVRRADTELRTQHPEEWERLLRAALVAELDAPTADRRSGPQAPRNLTRVDEALNAADLRLELEETRAALDACRDAAVG